MTLRFAFLPATITVMTKFTNCPQQTKGKLPTPLGNVPKYFF